MIQNPAGFTLDLDIVTDILPMEDSSLFLDDSRDVDVAASFLGSGDCSGDSFLIAAPLVQDGRGMSSSEQQNFALRLLRSDELGSNKVCST